MTGAPGFLEFFILEASEYVEQLDGLLLRAGSIDPDVDTLQRLSRALRGSATMAKLPGFANLAAAMERVARAMREGELRWDPALRGALVAAVDDLKTLLHSARNWSPDDDRRAGSRVTELTLYAPPRTSGAFRPIGDRSSSPGAPFLGNEAANIAAGLELLTTRPATNVLGRIRALRGVAEVKEVSQLADVLEATEDAAHGLDAGGTMTPETRRVLETATAYLRMLTPALRGSGSVDAPSSARDEFNAAVNEWRARSGDAERVVPIADLFYDDGGSGLVEASPNPPTSPQARFRLEMVSLAEHLRGVVDALRRAPDAEAVHRARRELVRALRALQSSAQSFGQAGVASRIAHHVTPARLESPDLLALDSLATSLAEPSTPGEKTPQGARRVSGAQPQPAQADVKPPTPPTPPMPQAAPPPPPRRPASPSMIDRTIAKLDELTATPMMEPTPIPEDAVVPIGSLLYRGRSALDRALEIRDTLRRVGPTSDPAALEELFDLVELARSE